MIFNFLIFIGGAGFLSFPPSTPFMLIPAKTVGSLRGMAPGTQSV